MFPRRAAFLAGLVATAVLAGPAAADEDLYYYLKWEGVASQWALTHADGCIGPCPEQSYESTHVHGEHWHCKYPALRGSDIPELPVVPPGVQQQAWNTVTDLLTAVQQTIESLVPPPPPPPLPLGTIDGDPAGPPPPCPGTLEEAWLRMVGLVREVEKTVEEILDQDPGGGVTVPGVQPGGSLSLAAVKEFLTAQTVECPTCVVFPPKGR